MLWVPSDVVLNSCPKALFHVWKCICDCFLPNISLTSLVATSSSPLCATHCIDSGVKWMSYQNDPFSLPLSEPYYFFPIDWGMVELQPVGTIHKLLQALCGHVPMPYQCHYGNQSVWCWVPSSCGLGSSGLKTDICLLFLNPPCLHAIRFPPALFWYFDVTWPNGQISGSLNVMHRSFPKYQPSWELKKRKAERPQGISQAFFL